MTIRTSLVSWAIAASLVGMSSVAQAGTIRGNLINGTTDEAGVASSVRLIDMAAGMDQIGLVMDAEGRFIFENVPSREGAPYVIQVQSGGVLYSQPVNLPGEETSVDFMVYETTDDLSDVTVSLYHVIFQRHGDTMDVMEFLEFNNSGEIPRAVWREGGPITVQVPDVVLEKPSVQISTTSRVPLTQELLETDDDSIFTVPQALKPGVTRVVIRSKADYSSGEINWEPRMFHPVEQRSVLVSPDDVHIHGDGLTQRTGDAPLPGYAVYEGGPLAAGATFAIHVEGGSAEAADPHAGLNIGEDGGGGGGGDADHSQHDITGIEIRANSLNSARKFIMPALGLVLILGLAAGLQRPRDSTDRASTVLREIARLEDRFLAGEIDRNAFEASRRKLKNGSHRKQGAGSAPRG